MQAEVAAFRLLFLNVDHDRAKEQILTHTHTRMHLDCRSYLSRYFSEKSTMVGNMGAGLYAGSL